MGGDGCEMSRFFIEKCPNKGEAFIIDGENFHHMKNVLRHKVNDRLILCDGSGLEYFVIIKKIYIDCLEVFIEEVLESQNEASTKITLFQGLPKADKFEYIIQKAVELGVFNIVPVRTSRSIVKLEKNTAKKKMDRWQKIAFEASKQSQRAIIPKIEEIISFEEAVSNFKAYDLSIIPYEKEKINTVRRILSKKHFAKNIAILIGPEGGFEEEEINLARENSIIPVTLGNRILRTETASIATISMFMYEFEQV